MGIRLGNLQFNQIRTHLGFQLTEEDKLLWDKYHNNNTDLSGMDNCFHVFEIPRSIIIKGDEMKEVILKMFSPDKLVEPMGKIQVSIQN